MSESYNIAHLGQVQTGTVAAVVVVSVHVEDLLALDRQQAGQDTFCETGTKHDDLITASQTNSGRKRVDARRILHPWLAVVCVCV